MIKNIINGHVNELLKSNTEISEDRLKICKLCPLFINKWYGMVCNSGLYINPITNETSIEFSKGFIKGCGCRLEAKTRDRGSKCPAKKW